MNHLPSQWPLVDLSMMDDDEPKPKRKPKSKPKPKLKPEVLPKKKNVGRNQKMVTNKVVFKMDPGQDVTLVSIDPGKVNIAIAVIERAGKNVKLLRCFSPSDEKLDALRKTKMGQQAVWDLLEEATLDIAVTHAVIESQTKMLNFLKNKTSFFARPPTYRFAQYCASYFLCRDIPCTYKLATTRNTYFGIEAGLEHRERKRKALHIARTYAVEHPEVIPPGKIADSFVASDHSADAVLLGLAMLSAPRRTFAP